MMVTFSLYVYGQTCCSAGASISSSLDITAQDSRTWAVQLGYEYKSINLLINDNQRLTNDPRSRSGQNGSLKVDFALSEHWAFSALLPLVYQERSTISENQNSFGIGDLMLLAQYSLFFGESSKLSFTGGLKTPTGIIDQTGTSNILLSPDMQSGSGSYDYLVRLALIRDDFVIPYLSGFISSTYRNNGINNNFGQTASFPGRRFGFGDEIIIASGLSYLWTTKHGFVSPDLKLRYRRSDPNVEQNTIAPNSGGNWLSLPLGVSFTPGVNSTYRLYTEIPLYQSLTGLQITTDFTVGLQFNYTFNKK